METFATGAIAVLDGMAVWLLLPLSVWILLNGLDDLFVLAAFLANCAWDVFWPAASAPRPAREKMIAVFVPCWRESAVIEDMVGHNISAIRYRNYHFFIGGYPNDEDTLEAVRRLEPRFANVHLSVCPHDGPTSKADCLNWIYQQMLFHEEEHDMRFDLVVTHDAEDIIHGGEFREFNAYARDYGMIQTAVAPLPTPWREFTHGLYCDDFAEAHTKDLVARMATGGFLPSCGVGTAFRRKALENLARKESNRIFEPACLTEDYENGYRLRRLGCRQLFLPLRVEGGTPVATREYFPRRFADAVRQRTRWVTGISLQTTERHGWRGTASDVYWMWRDRKGLLGSPVSLLANALFVYGFAGWALYQLDGGPWPLGVALSTEPLATLLGTNLGLMLIHLATRMICVGRIYGWCFALGVPLRAVYGNFLNTAAAGTAVFRYARARIRREPLVWVKTEHAYPSRVALLPHKRSLEDILVGSAYLTKEQLARSRATKPRGVRLAEHLVQSGVLTEEELYEALSLQLGLALAQLEPFDVRRNVARSLPAHVIREWNVLPVRIQDGSLTVATPGVPREGMRKALARFTSLPIRVEIVTPTSFRRLADEFL